jgi:hypothetical protein
MSQNYQAEYDKIDAAMEDGLPKTALQAAESLYQLATTAGDEDQVIKAMAYRATFVGQTEEKGLEATVKLLREELAASNARPAAAAVFNYMIGATYYNYASSNRYAARTNTALTTDSTANESRPLAEWPLPQLTAAATEHLYRALALARTARTQLTAVPAIVFASDSPRIDEQPTLYDLLARASLSMLANPLLSVTDPEVSQPEKFLGNAAAFVVTPLTMDPESGVYRKLKLYQQLTNFHLGPLSPALLAVDLERLHYVRQLGADTDDYLAALRRMQTTYRDLSGGQILLVREATLYANARSNDETLGERPKATALTILDRITDTSAVVATPAEQLRRQIMNKTLDVTAETVYPTSGNLHFSVSYRNVDQVYHRLYPVPGSGPDDGFSYWNLDKKALATLVSRKPLAATDFRLPTNDDYERHTTESWLPKQNAGQYYLLTSSDPSFDLDKGYVAITDFQVSNLAVIRHDEDNKIVFEVVDRTTGAARPGLTAELQTNAKRNKWVTVSTVTTDDRGRITAPNTDGYSIRLIVKDPKTGDALITESTYGRSYEEPNRTNNAYTPLFTDRNIYRPGQTVKVYGLTWQKDPDQMPTILAGQSRELVLLDPNYQEVSKVKITSDEYGRFNTEFKLPESGLTGYFRLQTDGGDVSFRMEEYKRPRFEVELEGPLSAIAGEETEVTGTAKLYAGPGLDGAKVNYRVFLEEVSYWWWGRGGGNNDRELIADGTTETDGDGAFTITFTPAAIAHKNRRSYRFIVETDVADATGETHDASTTIALRSEDPVIALRPTNELIDVTDSLLVVAAGTEENLTAKVTITPVTKPGVSLKARSWAFPDRPLLDEKAYQKLFPNLAAEETPELEKWPTNGKPRYTGDLAVVEGEGRLQLALSDWPVGHYRIEWTYPDGTAGESSTFAVLDAAKAQLPPGQLTHLLVKERKATIGQPLTVTLISAVELPNIDAKWASRQGIEASETAANRTATFTYTPTEADRGGIELSLGFLRFGDVHTFREAFQLGWDNKKLAVEYATFRDKLRPGSPERWSLTIKNADGSPVMAAALASMYDASLDQISEGDNWEISPFPSMSNRPRTISLLTGNTNSASGRSDLRLPDLAPIPGLPELDLSPFSTDGRFGQQPYPVAYGAMQKRSRLTSADAPQMYSMQAEAMDSGAVVGNSPPPAPQAVEKAAEPPVQIRKNLQETAFWLPDLTSDQDGKLVISFDSPEALTSWKFRLLAHDKELATAVSEQTIVTQKELMVLPNVPRFVREGDAIGLTARVNNMTDEAMDVTVSLELFDPVTDEVFATEVLTSLGAAAGAKNWVKEQAIPAESGATVRFDLTIPEGFSERGAIGYRVIARAEGFSDGEENVMPVLTDRTLITVSQPFYLKKGEKKTLELPILANGSSPTRRHVGYTFQATTNPAWLALKSLPYLMEYPYDCTEQLANRYFANQLAYATVSRKPILEQVFREWQKDSNALKSELERNANLKNALLTETPWVREAQSESQQRARIGDLFQLKQLADEQTAALTKLEQRQSAEGYFSWFPGGRENQYMTQYVVETLARLKQLGVVTPDQQQTVDAIFEKSITWLDQQLLEEYNELQQRMKDKKDWEANYRPSSTTVHYLYARALSDAEPGQEPKLTKALSFYTTRAAAGWLDYGLYEQALLATTDALNNRKSGKLATTIVRSLRERAFHQDEFGMYWKYDRGYQWHNLPIETHCRLLEAFQLAGGTTEELDELRLWLLTNKRTNRWETTKSTAAAVFALLNTSTDWTDESGKPLEVSWPNAATSTSLASRVRAAQSAAEAATGAFSIQVEAKDIGNGLGVIKLKNPDNRIVWGGIFYQYTELAAKVEGSNGGPLSLERTLFRSVATDDGIRLEPIRADQPLKAGDRVTVKLTLRTDRDLDYVHLKDRRAATFEPIGQLSGYKYEGSLGYYYAPGDLATNFFIDNLPKGVHYLEYDLFATYPGTFSNGLGRMQCMYAPEFGANTDGATIVVE